MQHELYELRIQSTVVETKAAAIVNPSAEARHRRNYSERPARRTLPDIINHTKSHFAPCSHVL